MKVIFFIVIVLFVCIYELRKLNINNIEITSFIISMIVALTFGVVVILGEDIFKPLEYINNIYKPLIEVFNKLFP